MTKAFMSDPGDRWHVADTPQQVSPAAAEREARAILAETEPRPQDAGYVHALAACRELHIANHSTAAVALAESLASFIDDRS